MRYRTKYTLRQWRRLRNISMMDLADRLGVNYTTIWRWENGQMPNAKYIPLLEKELDIKWSDDVLMEKD